MKESETSPEQALKNMHILAEDITRAGGTVVSLEPYLGGDEQIDVARMGGTKYQPEHDGRYPFLIEVHVRTPVTKGINVVQVGRSLVEMPGIPTDDVRFLGLPEQNILDFPRLYLNGSSGLWKYTINRLTDPKEPASL